VPTCEGFPPGLIGGMMPKSRRQRRRNHVRFAFKSRHHRSARACPLRARSKHVRAMSGRVIALSIEPFYNPSGRRVLLAREQRRLAAIVTTDVVGYAHAVYEQIYYLSLMPRTYLCVRLLETFD